MRLKDLQVTAQAGRTKLSVTVESERLGRQELWFSTLEKYAHLLCTDRLDAFLVAMLFPAIQYGEDVHVQGTLSDRLLFNLNNYAVPLLTGFTRGGKAIRISADATCSEAFAGSGVGAGFSGGVDSFCTIYDRFQQESSPRHRINTLLFLNVGSHGGAEGGGLEVARQKFTARYDHLKQFPDEIGLEFIPLDSNIHVFHPWGHQKTHTLTSMAGVLNFQKHFAKYYYASAGLDYAEMLETGKHYRGIDVGIYCDPILLPLLSTESTELVADGYPYSRSQKLLHVMPYEPLRRYLNVCVSDAENWENCSKCPKCCRTLMTLEAVGRLDDFGRVFAVKKFAGLARLKYLCKQVVLAERDPFAADNVRLARARGMRLPSYALSRAVYALSLLKRFAAEKLVKAGS